MRVVDSVEEAIDHVNQYGSGHSEAIVTNDRAAARAFQLGIDSACIYVNASTRFTDGGEFGMGAEIGNSTQKLHARGPIGLRELCSTRYLVDGEGQIRGLSASASSAGRSTRRTSAISCARRRRTRSSGSTAWCSCRSTQPPHKEAESDPGVEHRVELCRRAVAGDPRFSVSRLEADAPGRSFTVDTLRRLHESSPEDELTFIMGGDMAHALPTWHEPEAVLSLATLGVAEREGVGRTDITRTPRRARRRRPNPLLRHAPSRHLLFCDPPPRRGRPARSATSCPTPWPPTSTPRGCTDERPQTAGQAPRSSPPSSPS